ncbi:UNVERIFIED_CONTAM: hypothetical protein GTU68_029228 [Idotea baltica]|nr:hypothetical protein [Idotea baltica]
MRLDMGGHLTHGSPMNFSGKHYKVAAYGVCKDTHLIQEEEVRALALEHKPKMIIAGASAYPRKIDFEMFKRVADEVGAYLMSDIAHYAGLIAAGEYPSPFPYSDAVTTTTHKTLRGPRSGVIMCKKEHLKKLNKAVFPGLQGGPHMHTIAAKAVAFKEAATPEFKQYAKDVIANARELSAKLTEAGFSIVSGGTDSHIVLVDVRPAGINGKIAQETLDKVGVTGNKNTIPFDPEPPLIGSGIRLGTPALTTRGMGISEMGVIADIIKRTLASYEDENTLKGIRKEVIEFSKQFPLYSHKLI